MAKPDTIAELLARLGTRAPFAKAAAWDPVGLQIGDPAAPARTLALCHEASEAVVARLEAEPADLLVAYHPLLFRPATRWVAGPGPEGRALRLARAGVALAVVHTSFDVARGGAADALAEALGLEALEGFAPLHGADSVKVVTFLPGPAADGVVRAVAAAGAGVIGNYTHCSFRAPGSGSFFAAEGTDPAVGRRGELNLEPEVRLEFVAPRSREAEVLRALVAAHPYEEPAYDVYDRRGDAGMAGRVGRTAGAIALDELARRVAQALGGGALRVAGGRARRVERVAVVPGAGSDQLDAAADARADAIVTGDVPHHRARAALERGLAVVDPGHVATERPGLERLLGWLREIAPDCRSLLDLDPDPWEDLR